MEGTNRQPAVAAIDSESKLEALVARRPDAQRKSDHTLRPTIPQIEVSTSWIWLRLFTRSFGQLRHRVPLLKCEPSTSSTQGHAKGTGRYGSIGFDQVRESKNVRKIAVSTGCRLRVA